MKKGNVGAGQMEQFVSDLFSAQPQEQKPKEESWSQVSKKSDKKASAQRQQGTGFSGRGGSAQRGRGAMRGDRGDRGRSAPNRTMDRSVRNNNNNNRGGASNNGGRSGLDKQGRDRNPGPRVTAGNADFAFSNQVGTKDESKTDATAAAAAATKPTPAATKPTPAAAKAKVAPAKIAAAGGAVWGKGSKSIIETHKEQEKKKADAEARAIAIASGAVARSSC